MSLFIALLAGLTAAAYISATVLVLKKRGLPQIGSPAFSIGAAAAFVLDRFFPENEVFAALATAAVVFAAAKMMRRGSAPATVVLAMLPLAAMLLVVDRPFFPPALATQFQNATIGVLCAGGPVALISLLLERSKFRRTSAR